MIRRILNWWRSTKRSCYVCSDTGVDEFLALGKLCSIPCKCKAGLEVARAMTQQPAPSKEG